MAVDAAQHLTVIAIVMQSRKAHFSTSELVNQHAFCTAECSATHHSVPDNAYIVATEVEALIGFRRGLVQASSVVN